MRAFLTAFFADPKHQAGLTAGLALILVQLATKWGIGLDSHMADVVSGGIVTLALAAIAGHAADQVASTKGDAQVDVAKVEAGQALTHAGSQPQKVG